MKATTLKMTALNDYKVDVPASDAENYDVVVAYKVDGKYMRIRDKGPFCADLPPGPARRAAERADGDQDDLADEGDRRG